MVAKKRKKPRNVCDVTGTLSWRVFRWSLMASLIVWTLIYQLAQVAGEAGIEDFVYVNF